ncbi:cadherin-like domain-containing protein, partial [uncultured Shewanella sp.]
ADGSVITIAGVGSFSLDSNGSYTFTPVANYNGDVPAIHYVTTDGDTTDSSTLTININAQNDSYTDADET